MDKQLQCGTGVTVPAFVFGHFRKSSTRMDEGRYDVQQEYVSYLLWESISRYKP